jgi:hypothetical protein
VQATGDDFDSARFELHYVDSSAQTEICCSLDDTMNDVNSSDDVVSESGEEMSLSLNDQQMSEQLESDSIEND